MQLLADNLLHPALPESAFRVVRQETAAALEGEMQSPEYITGRALSAGLYPKGDPVLREAKPDTVRSLKLADVKSYYNLVCRPDLTTIVVIGNVTTEEAKAAVEKYFGGWRAQGRCPETALPSVPLNTPSATTIPDEDRIQAEVTLAETLGITRVHPDYYALELGCHVLGGAFYASRLDRDLREHGGLVYSVDLDFTASRTRSSLEVAYDCATASAAEARSIVQRDLREMQHQLVTASELKQACALLVRRIPVLRSSVEGVAEELLDLVDEDLPLDEPQKAAERYAGISAEEVRAAFEAWVRPKDLVEVTLGPSPEPASDTEGAVRAALWTGSHPLGLRSSGTGYLGRA